MVTSMPSHPENGRSGPIPSLARPSSSSPARRSSRVIVTAREVMPTGWSPRPWIPSGGPLNAVPRLCQRGREVAAGADAELAIGVAEMDLDGLGRDEQRLGDVAVALAVGGER